MADAKPIAAPAKAPEGATGVLVLANGEVAWGRGFGAEGQAVGEVCFHTAMTGYQEVMTDPSFAGQMVTFTFPHIGNVGANPDDIEADDPHALGIIVREDVTAPSNFRSVERLDAWMARHGRIGLSGIDTRALTRRIRMGGAPNGVIAHAADGVFDVPALLAQARGWPGLEGMDLARDVTAQTHYGWEGGVWRLGFGYSSPLPPAGGAGGGTNLPGDVALEDSPTSGPSRRREGSKMPHVVAIDYGAKRNIYRNLAAAGARVSVLPATASFDEVMALKPDGIFLSNGPGDPAATGEYAVPVIRALLETRIPLFGICLGHQLLALAVGAQTTKMFQGHRGANHPVKRLSDGVVEITSMNHGFAVLSDTLPETARETHVSLFDGSNAGFELTDRPAFSVQYHPEASPGPQDSLYLFERFVGMLRSHDEVLNRILSRDGLYWRYPGDQTDDADRCRWVEMRLDVKGALAAEALKILERDGWKLESRPDKADGAVQRLYVRKLQSLGIMQREAMLITGYEASEAGEGRLWSWVNVDDEQSI